MDKSRLTYEPYPTADWSLSILLICDAGALTPNNPSQKWRLHINHHYSSLSIMNHRWAITHSNHHEITIINYNQPSVINHYWSITMINHRLVITHYGQPSLTNPLSPTIHQRSAGILRRANLGFKVLEVLQLLISGTGGWLWRIGFQYQRVVNNNECEWLIKMVNNGGW